VANYISNASSGEATPVTNKELSANPLQLYFVQPGTYVISLALKKNAAPLATATLQVLAPHFPEAGTVVPQPQAMLQGSGCTVGITSSDPIFYPNQGIGLGLNDTCPSSGMFFNYAVSTVGLPAKSAGSLSIFQLITEGSSDSLGTCKDSTIGESPAADSKIPYANIQVPVASGLVAAAVLSADSPAMALPQVGVAPLVNQFARQFFATDYLMYQPGTTESIWVPLSEMTWGFSSNAVRANPASLWTVGPGTVNPVPPVGTTFPLSEPTWKKTAPKRFLTGCPGIKLPGQVRDQQ
jgi:hypothetical protein